MDLASLKAFFVRLGVLLVMFWGAGLPVSPTAAQAPILNPCTNEPFISLLTNASILKAYPQIGSLGNWEVRIELVKDEITRAFSEFTETHQGQVIAVTLDGVVQIAPIVQARLEDVIVLSGNFSAAEAKEIAAIISTEPLPVPLSYDSIGVSGRGTRLGFSLPESIEAGVLGQVIAIVDRRLSLLEVSGVLVFGVGSHQISLDLPGGFSPEVVIPALVRPGLLELVDGSIPEGCTAERLTPGQVILTTEGQKRSR